MNRKKFVEELKKMNLFLTEEKLEKLRYYYEILKEENAKYNLTRIIKEEEVYLKHFYDSLTIIKVTAIGNNNICDLGSGAGFPGLVLAICFPESTVTLIESNSKKCKFLKKVKETLSLQNVTIINARIEDYAKENREVFDIVTARAVAPLKHLLEYGIPLVKVKGYFIAMKANIEEEIVDIEKYYTILKIIEVEKITFYLPSENSLRTLLKYQKLDKTNKKYPRRYSEIKKCDIV